MCSNVLVDKLAISTENEGARNGTLITSNHSTVEGQIAASPIHSPSSPTTDITDEDPSRSEAVCGEDVGSVVENEVAVLSGGQPSYSNTPSAETRPCEEVLNPSPGVKFKFEGEEKGPPSVLSDYTKPSDKCVAEHTEVSLMKAEEQREGVKTGENQTEKPESELCDTMRPVIVIDGETEVDDLVLAACFANYENTALSKIGEISEEMAKSALRKGIKISDDSLETIKECLGESSSEHSSEEALDNETNSLSEDEISEETFRETQAGKPTKNVPDSSCVAEVSNLIHPDLPDKIRPESEVILVGKVTHVVSEKIIIQSDSIGGVSAGGPQKIIDCGSILCLDSRDVVGLILDPIGPVCSPFYVGQRIKESVPLEPGTQLYTVLRENTFVNCNLIKQEFALSDAESYFEESDEDSDMSQVPFQDVQLWTEPSESSKKKKKRRKRRRMRPSGQPNKQSEQPKPHLPSRVDTGPRKHQRNGPSVKNEFNAHARRWRNGSQVRAQSGSVGGPPPMCPIRGTLPESYPFPMPEVKMSPYDPGFGGSSYVGEMEPSMYMSAGPMMYGNQCVLGNYTTLLPLSNNSLGCQPVLQYTPPGTFAHSSSFGREYFLQQQQKQNNFAAANATYSFNPTSGANLSCGPSVAQDASYNGFAASPTVYMNHPQLYKYPFSSGNPAPYRPTSNVPPHQSALQQLPPPPKYRF